MARTRYGPRVEEPDGPRMIGHGDGHRDQRRRDEGDPSHGPGGTALVLQPGTDCGAEPSGVAWDAEPGQRSWTACSRS